MMAEAAKKRKKYKPETAKPKSRAALIDHLDPAEINVGVSPALTLQEQVASSMLTGEDKYPARYVTSTVITICLASWYAVYLFINGLF